METTDFISQAWMLIFGSAAIWLLGRREDWRRWGYIAGLISQPAWLFKSDNAYDFLYRFGSMC